jgi:hypothetical protein
MLMRLLLSTAARAPDWESQTLKNTKTKVDVGDSWMIWGLPIGKYTSRSGDAAKAVLMSTGDVRLLLTRYLGTLVILR